MVQREGRILRQGNTCKSVKIYRYITKGSFDAYSWQLLEAKQRFISQILSGYVCQREGDDVDEAVLNYAEVKALAVGNPLIKQRVEIMNQLDKYRILHNDFKENRLRKQKEIELLPQKIATLKERIANTQKDIDYFNENKIDYSSLTYEEQSDIREKIYNAVKAKENHPLETEVLTYQGFKVVVPAHMIPKVYVAKNEGDDSQKDSETVRRKVAYVFVKRNESYVMDVESKSGITKRLNNLLDKLNEIKENRENELKNMEYRMASLEEEMEKTEDTFSVDIERLKQELDDVNNQLGVSVE